jgi:hypothetical protein
MELELDDFINFKNLIATYDESELIKESIVFASEHRYIDEKVPKQYFNPFIDFIWGSSLLEYENIEDIYFKPCVDDYENIYNEKYCTNVKKYSNAPQLCTFLANYDPNPCTDDSDDANSDDADDANIDDVVDANPDDTVDADPDDTVDANPDDADDANLDDADDANPDDQDSESSQINLIKNLFFKSNDGSTILFYIDFKINDKDLQMFGLINFNESIYIFCGTSCAHPFVVTNDFSYDNSDSKCPNISIKLASVNSTKKLFPRFIKYFKKFCNDSYH